MVELGVVTVVLQVVFSYKVFSPITEVAGFASPSQVNSYLQNSMSNGYWNDLASFNLSLFILTLNSVEISLLHFFRF